MAKGLFFSRHFAHFVVKNVFLRVSPKKNAALPVSICGNLCNLWTTSSVFPCVPCVLLRLIFLSSSCENLPATARETLALQQKRDFLPTKTFAAIRVHSRFLPRFSVVPLFFCAFLCSFVANRRVPPLFSRPSLALSPLFYPINTQPPDGMLRESPNVVEKKTLNI